MAISRKSDRRRRLLVDGNTPLGETQAARESNSGPPPTNLSSIESRLYTVAAERRHQRKTTDLIPKRRIAVATILSLVALAVVILNVLAINSPNWEPIVGRDGVAALKIWGPGTLATWFASVCWVAAAAICAQIFVLRRHRNDDYEGTYRVWGWLAFLSLFASALCSVDIPGVIFHVASWATHVSLFEPNWLIPATISVVVGLVVVRALFEVRCSYGTVAWYTMAWIAWSISTVASMNGSDASVASSSWMGLSTELVTGNGLLLTAVFALFGKLNYARYVFLRANGLVKAPQTPIETRAESVDEEEVPAAKPAQRKRTTRAKAKTSSRETKQTPTIKTKTKVTPAKEATAKETTAKETASKKPQDVAEQKAAESPKPSTIPLQVISASKNVENEAANSNAKPEASLSASEKLRQLAEVSRARQKSQSVDVVESQPEISSTQATNKKMSKAEKRKLRKAQRKAKRAA